MYKVTFFLEGITSFLFAIAGHFFVNLHIYEAVITFPDHGPEGRETPATFQRTS